MVLPLFDGERLQQIRMHMRRARKDKGEGRDGVRFIVEAELSRLGPLQLDGLVRMPAFDLVVRSREPLAPAMRADILQIFGDALAAAGLKGGVTFTATPDIRPGPFEDRPDAGYGLTV